METLTHRETEVLQLLAEGYTNQEIAVRLRIGAGTVKSHVEHIISKLGASGRTQAAVLAVQQGLVTVQTVALLRSPPRRSSSDARSAEWQGGRSVLWRMPARIRSPILQTGTAWRRMHTSPAWETCSLAPSAASIADDDSPTPGRANRPPTCPRSPSLPGRCTTGARARWRISGS